MNIYILLICGSFILSIVCGFIFIPIILNFCKEHRIYDIPNLRKVHKTLVPRLGGISFLPSMLIAFSIAMVVMRVQQGEEIVMSLWSIYFLIGCLIIYSIGMVDDIVGIRATTKFIMQIIAACFLPLAGLYINNLYGFLGIWEIPPYIGMPLTVFIIVFIVNAMNLIDGIDGLCAGLSIISLTGFLYLFMQQRVWIYCILISGLIGILVAYSYFNIWGKVENNTKIFMGDAGSLTLGYVLSFLFVKYSMDNPIVMPYRKDGLIIAFSLLLIPIFDVIRVSIARIRHNRGIFDADKNHIHHKLIRTGMSEHQALVTILIMAMVYIFINFGLLNILYGSIIFAIDIVLYIIFNVLINSVISTRGEKVFV